jgi:hypothetical protein
MAVRNAVLSQSPEFKEVRLSAYQDATMVYDLLAVATVRWGQVTLLQEVNFQKLTFEEDRGVLWFLETSKVTFMSMSS